MRKNNMLRIASVLLVAVLLTTCAISGVFAYYMTDDTASDEARVAKWGVDVILDNIDIFTTNYDDSVISSETTVDVVAPGTAGKLTGVSISGSPEVDVDVTYTGSLTLTGWEADGFYCPVVITIKNNSQVVKTISSADCADADAFNTAFKNALEGITNHYEANVGLAQVGDDLDIEWVWAFGNESSIAKDTILGDAAAEDNAATIKVELTTIITQAD